MCVNLAKTCLSSTHSQHVRTGEQRHLLTCSWYPAAAGKLPIRQHGYHFFDFPTGRFD